MNYNFFEQNSIETPFLTVKGNLICWQNTIIQISNISSISKDSMNIKPFPSLSLIVALAGWILISVNSVPVGVCLLAIGIGWFATWLCDVYQKSKLKKLVFVMNSGEKYTIIFGSLLFLEEVLKILTELLAFKNESSNIVFNIKDNKIDTMICDNEFHDDSTVIKN
ncbi:hypothetical protein B5F08_11920 [Anaeromassilibacillus sp. An172]|uniref:hypothetical protein n=1 Tax=Anaeromassilibacillus sp. An172 TaxID=1965570 RepID=UPI000B3782BD|nr:hypothetical protein [Anaeromassilibacillus sp. An172]OUP74627.1 hypothetical protein B5F08_11920 [Anaeromassilibacillus sp. An172]